MAACSWMVETHSTVRMGWSGSERFSGDVTSAGNSCLQDILSPGGLHMLPRCCSPSLERWIVLLNRIQAFGFLSEVSFWLTCLFSVQQLPSTEHPSGLVWAAVCSLLSAPEVRGTSSMLSVLFLRTLLLMYLITKNYLWHKNIEV